MKSLARSAGPGCRADTEAALFATGTLPTLVTRRSALLGRVEMVLVGGTAAALAYVVGRFIAQIGG
ncbi:MAG: hypothetical protein ACLFQR_13150 [Desulfovibrionales bacterium]